MGRVAILPEQTHDLANVPSLGLHREGPVLKSLIEFPDIMKCSEDAQPGRHSRVQL